MVDKISVIRSCLLYKFKLGSNVSEVSRKINFAFREDAVKERITRNWFQKFSQGDENLEYTPRCGGPVILSNDER